MKIPRLDFAAAAIFMYSASADAQQFTTVWLPDPGFTNEVVTCDNITGKLESTSILVRPLTGTPYMAQYKDAKITVFKAQIEGDLGRATEQIVTDYDKPYFERLVEQDRQMCFSSRLNPTLPGVL